MKIQKYVFYGCKQKNNDNVFLELDLFNLTRLEQV